MKKLIDLNNEKAKKYFLKGSSYFKMDLPEYISFEPIINAVSKTMKGKCFKEFEHGEKKPNKSPGVNYELITNKDGKLAWRPLELIHPALYVSLVNVICEEKYWNEIKDKFKEFEGGVVNCCSIPVVPVDNQSHAGAQVMNWHKQFEQRSLTYSLEFSHVLHTDIADCYGSLYTHSISWALHGVEKSKEKHDDLGNKIDTHIQAGRYGQTNGISQGSVLMDFVAELVLGFVDHEINLRLKNQSDCRILRYRDDYRIFANSDDKAEKILKIISDKLRVVGMKLNTSKTYSSTNVIESSIKPDKLAGINLQDLGLENAKTIQKQLLKLHSFGQRFPNSGALKRLVSELRTKIKTSTNKQAKAPYDDLKAQIAIATDIAFVSPATTPAVAVIVTDLISLAPDDKKENLRRKVRNKMKRVPYNGYLEIWLQRMILPNGIEFSSDEAICKIANKEDAIILWENEWISSKDLLAALRVSQILISSPKDSDERIHLEETQLFAQNAYSY